MQYHPNQLLKNAVVSLPPQSTYTVSLLKGTSPPPTRRPFCQASRPSSNRTSLISFSLTSSLHCNLILPTLYAFRCRPMVVTLALFQLPTYSYLKLCQTLTHLPNCSSCAYHIPIYFTTTTFSPSFSPAPTFHFCQVTAAAATTNAVVGNWSTIHSRPFYR